MLGSAKAWSGGLTAALIYEYLDPVIAWLVTLASNALEACCSAPMPEAAQGGLSALAVGLIVTAVIYLVPNKATPNAVPAAPTLKSVAWLAVLITAVVMLSGCSLAPQYTALKAVAKEGVETAIQDRKEFNDVKAATLLELPCAASIGSVMRLEDARKRAILIELCGGPEADSQMTVDDVAAILDVIDRP